MSAALRAALEALCPGDAQEAADLHATWDLLDRGTDLYRRAVDRPDPHLVCYALVTDGAQLLLCHHRKADLWLPLGGHVEPEEDPQACAERELAEELGTALPLRQTLPFFLSLQRTQGPQPHHDLALWYVFRGDKTTAYSWDRAEFQAIAWVAPDALPPGESAPLLTRAIAKLRAQGHL